MRSALLKQIGWRGSIACCLVVLGASAASCERTSRDAPIHARNRDEAARKGLVELKRLAATAIGPKLGLGTPAEARSAILGSDFEQGTPQSEPPIAVFLVSKRAMAAYKGGPPQTLMGDTTEWLYPIVSNKSVMSSVRIERGKSGDYVVAAQGGRNLIRGLTKARRRLVNSAGVSLSSVVLIRIPAIGRMALAGRNGGTPVVLPLHGDFSSTPDSSVSPTFMRFAAEASGKPRRNGPATLRSAPPVQ